MPHYLSRECFRASANQTFSVDGQEFVLGGRIGDGAAGVVRKAIRKNGGTHVAVKFLAPDPKYIEESVFDDVAMRFEREGQRGAKLQHRGLVHIHAYHENPNGSAFSGEGPKNPLLIMEHIPGKTLESFIRRLPDDEQGDFQVPPDRLFVAIQIADALNYLHGRKIVHRDVKPANVFGYSGF